VDSDGSTSSLILIVIIVVSAISYLFAALAEGAISSLSRARVQRLAEQDRLAAARLTDFTERPAHYLANLAILRLVALSGAAVALTQLLGGIPPGTSTLVGWIGLVVAGLALGGAIPRAVAKSWAEEIVLALWIPLRFLSWTLAPIAAVVSAVTSVLSRLIGAEPIPEGPVVTPEELRVMVAASEEEGLIERQERTMIDNILELEGISVREVMVPRPDVVALPASTTVREAIETLVREGYSRVPIFDETIDNIVGILYGKDLFPLVLDERLEGRVGAVARPAYFVPESKKTDDLLRELQQNRLQIAIVVDEYGGTAGLVTIEDLLEEIVGEIHDEFDVDEEQKIVKNGEAEAVVDAAVSIDDVNDALSLDLHAEEVDTIGGLLYEQLGRVPVVGDEVNVDDALLTVLGATGRRVTRVKVTRLAEPPPNGSDSPRPTAGEA
jgi:putative hemolysin